MNAHVLCQNCGEDAPLVQHADGELWYECASCHTIACIDLAGRQTTLRAWSS